MIKVKELIITGLVSVGKGVAPHSSVRSILEVYTKEGTCLANKELSIDKIFEKWKN